MPRHRLVGFVLVFAAALALAPKAEAQPRPVEVPEWVPKNREADYRKFEEMINTPTLMTRAASGHFYKAGLLLELAKANVAAKNQLARTIRVKADSEIREGKKQAKDAAASAGRGKDAELKALGEKLVAGFEQLETESSTLETKLDEDRLKRLTDEVGEKAAKLLLEEEKARERLEEQVNNLERRLEQFSPEAQARELNRLRERLAALEDSVEAQGDRTGKLEAAVRKWAGTGTPTPVTPEVLECPPVCEVQLAERRGPCQLSPVQPSRGGLFRRGR